MPPKKGAKKLKKTKQWEKKSELAFEDGTDETDVLELNLYTDINDNFFNEASRIVQFLMEAERFFEASRIKRYADIIFNLHRRYVEEVNDNETLRPQIISTEQKLRLALELTATSEEALQKLKNTLGDAWKESDASALREQLVQEKLQEVLIKCEGLGDRDSSKTDDAAEFGYLAKYKNIILRERDRLAGEVIDMEKRLATNRYYSENLEYIIRNNEDALSKMASRAKFSEGERINVESKLRALMKSMEEQKESHEDQNNASTRLYKLNRKVMILNNEILRHKNNINSLEKDVLNASGRADDIRRIKDSLQKERDSLRMRAFDRAMQCTVRKLD
ncbi:hypothetical protein ACLKA6_009770 [Drosophila palustris]